METSHKAIDDVLPVVKAANSLSMYLKANESDIKVCGETNGYFREVNDFKAKFDELLTWYTNATSLMSQSVIDDVARMIKYVDGILPKRAQLESADAITSAQFKKISNEVKKTLLEWSARASERKTRIANVQAILSAGVGLHFDDEGLKDSIGNLGKGLGKGIGGFFKIAVCCD